MRRDQCELAGKGPQSLDDKSHGHGTAWTLQQTDQLLRVLSSKENETRIYTNSCVA